ncbi:MJ0042-type zinc finger domain-containing protein [Polycladidibacter stylochi]|uniref:MJ0042-type zinc finger domain-containing protein n=1 Tax=Polycladidibacter stylochi TaxID=1807766 RepID=UPI00082DC501|nr:MJ0042-type zinc finger domain-containing protein [Pseudovibrio stylochi]
MKITCESCQTSYRIGAEQIGAGGRKVKCARCGKIWHAVPVADGVGETPDERDQSEHYEDVSQPYDRTLDLGQEPKSERADYTENDTRGEDKDGQSLSEEGTRASSVKKTQEKSAKRSKKKPTQRKKSKSSSASGAIYPARAFGVLVFLSSIGLCLALVAYKNTVVKTYPDLASLYQLAGISVNTRGLSFDGLRTFREYDGGQPVLVVEGSIENVSEKPVPVPAILLSMRAQDQRELTAWSVVPHAKQLAPGQRTRFRTRLAKPSDMAADIQLRFITRNVKKAKTDG